MNTIGTQLRDLALGTEPMAYGSINKWTPPRKSGGIPGVSTGFSLSMEIKQTGAGRVAEPVSRDEMVRREREKENTHFPCPANLEQDWQPCPVDPFSAICDGHAYILHG